MKLLLSIAILVAVSVGVFFFLSQQAVAPTPAETDPIACTADAMLCPDGSYVGRVGPNCEFAACPEAPTVPEDVAAHITSKQDLIRLSTPAPLATVESPLTLSGEARGYWFFEASFPVVLVDWDGRIIAEHYATAEGEWMTDEFVPFSTTLTFESPYTEGDPDFMKRGALILMRDNPSGLPENDDALEIPIRFR